MNSSTRRVLRRPTQAELLMSMIYIQYVMNKIPECMIQNKECQALIKRMNDKIRPGLIKRMIEEYHVPLDRLAFKIAERYQIL